MYFWEVYIILCLNKLSAQAKFHSGNLSEISCTILSGIDCEILRQTKSSYSSLMKMYVTWKTNSYFNL